MSNIPFSALATFLFILILQTACVKDPIIVDPGTGSPTQVDGVFTTAQTWKNHNPDGIDYIVTGDITIQNASLTIEPGVEIVFENNTDLEIRNSTLKSIGAPASHIIFRGNSRTAGFWRGITIYGKNDNQMAYCDISDAGKYDTGGFSSFGGGAVIVGNGLGDATLSLENCRIENISTYGLYINDASKLSTFVSNTITKCDYPVFIYVNAVGQLAGTNNQFNGNTHDLIKVKGGQVIDNALWPALNSDYLCSDQINIKSEVNIEAGAKLFFDVNAGIELYNGIPNNCKLIADGTPAKPILFKGNVTQAGYWNGIAISGGLARLSNCVISDAGRVSASGSGNSAPTGAIWTWVGLQQVNVTVQNCTVSNSSSHGIVVRNNAVSNVTMSNNLFSGINGDNVHYW
jgi:Right handed beta helix region